MEGSLQDWRLLREHAEQLIASRCKADFAVKWGAALIPLLDRLVFEYAQAKQGREPDEPFWNSMIKRGGTNGSGARTWFNGWINILFPYILDKPNPYTVPYSPT